MLIDDFSDKNLTSKLGTQWYGASDKVMGGISDVSVSYGKYDDRQCLFLTGKVCLENNGGFVQAALNLAKSGDTIDASAYVGVRLVVRGNSEKYSVHLRTLDNDRPWQSYRASFTAFPRWKTISLPFVNFPPYRIEVPLDTTKLKRIGLVAIGRAFDADLALAEISFY